jgi:nucleoside-diphosphate-sugar epimerase
LDLPGTKIRVVRQTLPELDLDEPFDVVLHGAEVPVLDVTVKMAAHNDAALEAMLAAAKRFGAKRFVYLSSGAVYALQPDLEPPFAVQAEFLSSSPEAGIYAWSKYQSETEVRRFCQASGLSHVILRIFNVASRHVPLRGRYALGNFVDDLLDDARPAIAINGSGRDRRSFISGPQLARLLCHSLREAPDGAIYNACSGEEISIRDLAHLVCEAAGRSKPVTVAAPDALVRHYTGLPNLPPAFLSTREDIRHEIARLVASHSMETSVG